MVIHTVIDWGDQVLATAAAAEVLCLLRTHMGFTVVAKE